MLKHLNVKPQSPKRVVLLGGSGFIGQQISRNILLETHEVLSLNSTDLDLRVHDSVIKLKNILRKSDVVIFLSALTPNKGKDAGTFVNNILMMKHFIEALRSCPVAHLIYFSSDAVYGFERSYLSEESPVAPNDLYGAMHLSREVMLRELIDIPYVTLRVTMVYGNGDTHFAYGPNKFYQSAVQRKTIELFGNGEELRDYIHVEDVAEITKRVVMMRSTGILNVASGESISFKAVANLIITNIPHPIVVTNVKRINKITHRHHDITNLLKAFPAISLKPHSNGIVKYNG